MIKRPDRLHAGVLSNKQRSKYTSHREPVVCEHATMPALQIPSPFSPQRSPASLSVKAPISEAGRQPTIRDNVQLSMYFTTSPEDHDAAHEHARPTSRGYLPGSRSLRARKASESSSSRL
jgi:hypothetical protein